MPRIYKNTENTSNFDVLISILMMVASGRNADFFITLLILYYILNRCSGILYSAQICKFWVLFAFVFLPLFLSLLFSFSLLLPPSSCPSTPHQFLSISLCLVSFNWFIYFQLLWLNHYLTWSFLKTACKF